MSVKTGLCSISFRALTPEEIIKEMEKCGLEVIEWGSDVHAPCDDIEKLENIVRLQQKSKVKCCSYGTYFRLGANDTSELPQLIKAAKMLGTDVLRIWCGTKSSTEYTEKEKEELFNECRKAAFVAEKENVILCLECHRGTFTDEAAAALGLMQEISSEHFKMYWQPETIRNAEQNLDYARLLAPYTVNLHVFNWEPDVKKPLKEATELWKNYLACFDDNHNLLLEFMPDDRIESLMTETESLNKIIE